VAASLQNDVLTRWKIASIDHYSSKISVVMNRRGHKTSRFWLASLVWLCNWECLEWHYITLGIELRLLLAFEISSHSLLHAAVSANLLPTRLFCRHSHMYALYTLGSYCGMYNTVPHTI